MLQQPPARYPSRLTALFATLALCASTAFAQTVEFFSPQGEVKGVRQVTARFAQAMVPFGDPRELDPFAIDCVGKGQGTLGGHRRTGCTTSTATCRPACAAAFTLKPGLTALDGTPLDGGPALRIHHRRPRDRAQPALGRQPHRREPGVHPGSRRARRSRKPSPRNAYCVAAGVNERIGVRLVTGDERRIDPRQSQVVRRELPALAASRRRRRPHARVHVPAAGHRQRRREIPAPARRARFAAGDARLRAHAAAERRGEARLGQGHRVDVRRRRRPPTRRWRSRCARRFARRSPATA